MYPLLILILETTLNAYHYDLCACGLINSHSKSGQSVLLSSESQPQTLATNSTAESAVNITDVMTDAPQQRVHSVDHGGIANGMVYRVIMETPLNVLNVLKLELGYEDRDISNLSYLEKVCYIIIFLLCRYCLVIAVPVDRVALKIVILLPSLRSSITFDRPHGFGSF